MTDYFEIVLDGNTDVLRGFVAGYLAASGLQSEVYVCKDFNIEHDSLAHQLAEWIGLVEDRTHLVVPEIVLDTLEKGTGVTAAQLGIEKVETRRIESARFEFSWKTYNREAADALRARFAAPPEGVTLEGYDSREEIHEDEKGATGGYAPAHPYEAEGSGAAYGTPGIVIAWAAELRQEQFLEVKEIRLTYAD